MDLVKLIDFTDQVAVVTGGGKGIGLAIAQALLPLGAHVWLLDSDKAQTLQAVESLGPNAHFIHCDVTEVTLVKQSAQTIFQQTDRIDCLFNCAGISRITPALEADDDEWRQVLNTNINGSYWCCREFARLMTKQHKGSIVNLGSMSGQIVNRPQPATAYITSKSAVHMMTKSLACEWVSHGIRVNALAPGYIATEMTLAMRSRPELFNAWIRDTPMQRCGQAEEVAAAALFLASDAASYITGTILAVDGGYTAW